MGRKRVIDPDMILDAAEEVTRERGAGQVSLDAVAKRAGISKGGLMYHFPTKDALISAITKRDIGRFEEMLATRANEIGPVAHAVLHARIDVTEAESPESSAKGASLLAALAQTPEHLGPIRNIYVEELARFDPATEDGRRARVALVAIEGAFLLRGLGLVNLDDAEWAAIFDDIRALVPKGER